MPSSAIQLANKVLKQANVDLVTDLTSFSDNANFPYNIILDIMNDSLRELSRYGYTWIAESTAVLTYGVSTYQWSVGSIVPATELRVDPQNIMKIRREAVSISNLQWAQWDNFQNLYRTSSTVSTNMPNVWTLYAGVIELDVIPDQDYTLTVYYKKDFRQAVNASDTLDFPTADEDVLTASMQWRLNQKMGMAWEADLQIAEKLINSWQKNNKSSLHRGTFMKRLF